MDEAVRAVTVTRMDHKDGRVILLELSDRRTISLTVEDVLLLEERRRAKVVSQD